MKTVGREYFYSVSGLMVPKYIVDDEFLEYVDNFVEAVPGITDELESYVAYDLSDKALIREMERLYVYLCQIHAHWLEVEAAKILRLIEVFENELCRTLLTPFITNVRTLALDIQMAQNKTTDVVYRKRGEMERAKDVVSGMMIVITLLNGEDYKMAFDIAKSITELQDSDYILPLMEHIAANDKTQAINLASEINDIYQKKIDDINHAAKSGVRKKVLVVDDMPEILTIVGHMLKEYFQVLLFKDGESVIRAIDTMQQPDAFLLDIDMPKMNGFALAGKIRARAIYKKTPILFLTANSTRGNLIRSIEYKPKSFIVKPVNKDIVIARLSNCFSGAE